MSTLRAINVYVTNGTVLPDCVERNGNIRARVYRLRGRTALPRTVAEAARFPLETSRTALSDLSDGAAGSYLPGATLGFFAISLNTTSTLFSRKRSFPSASYSFGTATLGITPLPS